MHEKPVRDYSRREPKRPFPYVRWIVILSVLMVGAIQAFIWLFHVTG